MTAGSKRAVSVCAVALAAIGMVCCGATRATQYYQLAIPAEPPRAATADTYPVTLLVGPVTAPELYRGDAIVYRTGPEAMGTYEYHRWAASPSEMIEQNLLLRLRGLGRYRAVELLRSNVTGDFVLRGYLNDFEELDGPPLAARVSLEFELDDARTGATVWSHSYAQDEPVTGKNIKDISVVVEALDRNLQRGLTGVTAGLDQYFSAHPPK